MHPTLTLELTFLGAAGTVTGSRTLLETEQARVHTDPIAIPASIRSTTVARVASCSSPPGPSDGRRPGSTAFTRSEGPRQVFVTHGAHVPADTIRQLATERLGLPALVPDLRQTFELDGRRARECYEVASEASSPGAIRTEHLTCRRTRSATLPNTAVDNRVCPRLPRTTRFARYWVTRLTISIEAGP